MISDSSKPSNEFMNTSAKKGDKLKPIANPVFCKKTC